MRWDDAREMQSAGMAFGSHTHTHRILSYLSPDEQAEELQQSRYILAQHLGTAPATISYPVGGRGTFSAITKQLAREAGYRLAFSFLPGVIRSAQDDRYALPRYAVDEIRDRWSLLFRVGFNGLAA
jgi:peptidoglycan/xylan/chitin deacetylase (PgdA/CDA1 family)